jgi:outer membrane protein TolC
MNKFRCWLCLFICLAVVRCAFPQEAVKNYFRNRFNAKDVQVEPVGGLAEHILPADGKLHLRLPDFLALVLRNSADVQLTKLNVYTAVNSLTAAKGPFDPQLNLGFQTFRSVSPVEYGGGGSFGGGQVTLPETINSLSQNSSISYSQLLPTGQTFQASFTGDRSSGEGYPYASLFGNLNLSVTQPLLQGRQNLEALIPIRVAKSQIFISAKQSEATINTTLAQLAQQYWEAVLARENIRVNQQALDLAKKSYDHDKLALDLGALSKLQILQSESQLAGRERDSVSAEYQYKVSLDGIRRLIGADLSVQMRNTELVLDDDPSVLPDRTSILPFEQALEKALHDRAEVGAASAAIQVDNMNARLNRDQTLPRLDLGIQGGSSGPGFNQITAGSTVGVTTIAPSPGLGPTLQQVLDFRYPSYGGSLTAVFPFRNSTAQAGLANALVQRARDKYSQRQVQEQITLEVRQATHSIELADATIQTALKARDLSKRNADAEQERYELGDSTAFELLDSQTRLATFESALVSAYVSYQEAYVLYQRATQTLLSGYGMQLGLPSSP